jgi:hypothetical protein
MLVLLLLLLLQSSSAHFLQSLGHDAFLDAHLPGPKLM